MSAPAGPWHCPTCLRSVPPRVETCYCGTSREQAERAARAAEPESSGGRLPWIPLVLVAAALGVLVLSLRREAPEPAPPAPPPATAATPRPPPPLRGSPPRVGITVPRRPTPVPAAPLPPPAAPDAPPVADETAPVPEEPEPSEPEEDGLAEEREQARAAFEARLAALAGRRDALAERLRSWDASCGTGSSAVRPAGCVLLQEDIEGLVDEIDGGLRESEREARRGWVQPGVRRDLMDSYELDARTWGALRQRAAAALR